MKVPLLNLKPQLDSLRDEIIEAITKVVESTCYIMGPEIDELEKEIAEYCGTLDAVGVSSGTDALLLSLMALDVGPGDCVITTGFSFFATAGVISRLNAVPVFVDIDPESYNIDPELLEEKLGCMNKDALKRVKAIIVVHLYGQSAQMKKLIGIASDYGIPLIEDAAQAIGAEYEIDGDLFKVGSMGDFGCFSFFPSKNLGGIGDGGIITVNDANLAEILRIKRVHGGEKKYFHSVIGGNFRLDPVQAAVIRVKLPHLNQWHKKRRENANYYNFLFEKHSLTSWVHSPTEQHSGTLEFPHIYNQYVIRAEKRDKLKDFLTENGIGSAIYYPLPFHLQECFANLKENSGEMINSVRATQEVLALPVYPELSKEMLDYVVRQIKDFYYSHY